MKRQNLIFTLTLSALFCALLVIGTFIKIPTSSPVPITLQTLFILLSAFLLPFKASLLSILSYIALGLIGLPIFSGGGGLGYVLTPTFGFIIGFLTSIVLISVILKRLKKHKFWQYFCLSLFGVAIIYLIGIFYFAVISKLCLNTEYTFKWIFLSVCFPFIPKEAIVAILASITAQKLKPYIIKFTK